MRPQRVEALAWVLLYGGLLLASLGLFVQRGDAALGGAMIAIGALGAVAGVALIWLRSRMQDESTKEKP